MKKILLILVSLSFNPFAFTQVINSFPHTEDFESFALCGTTSGTTCALSNGWTNEASIDNIDWITDNGGTSSTNTGPAMDYNPGSASGKYLYLESSTSGTGYPNMEAHLITPLINATSITSGLKMNFWYHMLGSSMGTMHIDFSTDGVIWINDIVPSWTDNVDLWQEKEIDLSAYVGSTFYLRIRGITGSSYYSDMAVDNFIFSEVFALDAGVVSIDNPSIPINPGVHNVDVSFKNFGTDDITSCDIQWEVNGVVQTTYNWAGTATPGSITGPVTIGTYNFTGGDYTIRAWTSNVNAGTDMNNANDTTEAFVCTTFPAGTYTIGPTGTYPTFNDAVNQLACGIAGSVEFIIEPGTYNESIWLTEVPGASATNTITFNGVDNSLVTLVDDATTQNAIIEFEGADHFTFKNMTIQNTSISIDSWGVHLQQAADSNTIDSCVFLMEYFSGISDLISIVASGNVIDDYSEGDNANHLVISNNVISGGEMGIHLEGDGTTWMYNTEILNNDIYGMDDYGIYLDNQDSIIIHGNNIYDIQAPGGDGIFLYDAMNFYISENNIIANDWGLYIADGNYNLDGTPNGRSFIVNNMIYSSTDYAGYFDDFEEADVFHNTFSGKPGLRTNDIVNLDIRNNIFYSETDFAFECDDDITTAVVDYNLYYTPESNANFVDIGVNVYADLAAWQTAAPALNVNSLETNPVFISTDNLHIISATANDLGDNTVGIAIDIDGDIRPMGTSVDMGADEFTPKLLDAATVEILNDVSDCGDSTTNISLVIKNLGADTIFTAPLTVEVSNAITQTFNTTFNDTLVFNQTDTAFVGSINTYAGGTYDLRAYISLPGDEDFSNDTTLASFKYRTNIPPTGNYMPICYGDSTYLFVNSGLGEIAWYDSLTGGNMIDQGDTLWTNPLTNDTTIFIGYLTSTDSIETTYIAGNGCSNGNMFDITAINTIQIDSLAGNFATAGTQTVNLYYIPNSSYQGNETNAAAWTLWASVSVNANIGKSYINPITPLLINTNETFAIYIDYNCDYTTSANTYSNEDMEVECGAGLCSPFGSPNAPRTFNGTIYYSKQPCTLERTPVNVTPNPLANADYSYTESELLLSITDLSSDADSVFYDFGDGNTSNIANPVHTYAQQGTYTVCQIAYNNCNSDTVCYDIAITCTMPVADFSYMESELVLSITDLSSDADSVFYNFGDGNMSSLANPVHTYDQQGTYTVSQIAYNHCGSDTVLYDITITCTMPVPDFSYTESELVLSITDLSSDADSVFYDFGDGNTSNIANPVHTYAQQGIYTVSQIVYNHCGSDTVFYDITITCTMPVANFSYTESELVLSITDQSSDADSVFYDFGDGNTSNLPNPVHTYAQQGVYTVSQIAYNHCGSDTVFYDITITCTMPVAGFYYTVNLGNVDFIDTSANADSVFYDFGDGNTSNQTNPSHTYAANGSYDACQIAYNHCGSDTICQLIDITGIFIDELGSMENFKIFPNPNKGSFEISFELKNKNTVQIDIISLAGKKLYTKLYENVKGKISDDINLINVGSGVYILRIKYKDEIFSKKLIVE